MVVARSSCQDIYPEYKADGRDQLYYGFKAGVNYAWANNINSTSLRANPLFGIVSGAFIVLPLSAYLGIQPEFLFSQKGFKASGTMDGSGYSFTRTSSYIDLPLYFSVKPNEFLTLLAGPQLSYLIQQSDKFSFATSDILQQQDVKNNSDRKQTLGLAGGFDINLKGLVIDFRTGLDMINNNGNGTTTNPSYKNAWCQATLAYRFHL